MEFNLVGIAPDISRLVLRGRADAAAVDRIEAGISATVRATAGHVVLDMADVPYMASFGVRMLIIIGRLVVRRGSKLVIFGVQPQVMEVFTTIALSKIIPIALDEPAALALIRE